MAEHNPVSTNYGDIPIKELQSMAGTRRKWTPISSVTEDHIDESVLVRGRVQVNHKVGKNLAFLTLRKGGYTVQTVVRVDANDGVSAQMVKYAAGISHESFVDIEGIVQFPDKPITGASQQVEIRVKKIHCVSRAASRLPINIDDASRSEAENENLEAAGKQVARVNLDTRLDNRVLEMRTLAMQAIFRLEDQVENLFGQLLRSKGFHKIFTPKTTAGSSEGGAAVFEFEYKNQAACLAQSPQLHKQMAISGDFERVFVVGAVFRAEDSNTHRHLCEFTGLDVEMEIEEDYSEVMDIVDSLFIDMFDKLNETCQKELKAIRKQFPFEPLKEAGVDVDPLGDLNTESERTLGKLVLEKYGTEFYILYRYPLAVRPFYTMPCNDNEAYSNSFDVFMRGEEIISGSQRIHVPELLEARARECGIDLKSKYIDSFRYGVPPHGGFGAGLERIVMLFCGLKNIRQTSLFPRDPRRLEP
ncbi:aspartate--tRNA ligase 2, cytoplasmic-like protein [Tanacetum coccineum]